MYVNAKTQYQFRSVKNWSNCIGAFFLVAVAVGSTSYRWPLLFAVGGILTYFLFFYLEKQPIVLECPKCEKKIATNTPWTCGFCKKENRRADEFPFVHQCEHCSAQPKAYMCHHNDGEQPCNRIIFLSEDEQERGYASCIVAAPPPPPPPPQPTTEDTRKAAREQALHEIEMAELQTKLEAIKRRVDLGKQRPEREKIKEAFEKDLGVWMGAEDEAEAQRAIAQEKYKDNPEKLQRALDLIDACLNKHTPGAGN